MQIDKTQYDALSQKAVKVLGHELVNQMSTQQANLLNRALDRILLRHKGDVETVTPDEIEGQYDQIMHHVLPTGSYEHLVQ